jgi:hypothetical protein
MRKKPIGKMTTHAINIEVVWLLSAKSQSVLSPRPLVPKLLTRPSDGAPCPAAAVMSMVKRP